MVKNILVEVKQQNDELIPFKSGYYLGTCIKKKLASSPINQEMTDGWTPYTLSRVLPTAKDKEFLPGKGIKSDIWAFLFRSLDESIIQSFRASVAIDPSIKVRNCIGNVEGIRELDIPNFNKSVKFDTRSPIIIYDKKHERVLDAEEEDYVEQLKETIINRYEKETSNTFEEDLTILIDNHSKTQVKVSSRKNAHKPGYALEGVMKGPRELLEFAYLGGIGSSTALGCGCWEVSE